jgi:hypothetical protein
MDALSLTFTIVSPLVVAFVAYVTMYFNRLRENEETKIEEENLKQENIRRELMKR